MRHIGFKKGTGTGGIISPRAYPSAKSFSHLDPFSSLQGLKLLQSPFDIAHQIQLRNKSGKKRSFHSFSFLYNFVHMLVQITSFVTGMARALVRPICTQVSKLSFFIALPLLIFRLQRIFLFKERNHTRDNMLHSFFYFARGFKR